MMTKPLSVSVPRSHPFGRLAIMGYVYPDRRQSLAGWRSVARHVLVVLLGSAMTVPLVFAADSLIVSQREREFWPDELKLTRGSVVRIVNDDKVTHHIFIQNKIMAFDSGEQPIGKTVEIKFDKQGRFEVGCAIHPLMRLTVEIE